MFPPLYKYGKQSLILAQHHQNSERKYQRYIIDRVPSHYGNPLEKTPKIINIVTRAHFFCLIALTFTLALAADHSPLQDFRVADTKSQVLVNGLACKDPTVVEANDFFFRGLHIAGNRSNPVGSKVTPVTVSQLLGLNTLGISLARIDYAPWGTNPPHTHPRATEILNVIEGTLEVGFVTSNPGNRHVNKVLQKGVVFVFPVGLVHYQRNVGYDNAVAVAALSSQNPGVITIANAVFGATPDITSDVLVKAFQLEKDVVANLKSKF